MSNDSRSTDSENYSAWNPGLQSDIPASLWPLVTLFREENAFVSYRDAKELCDLTGLKVLELVSLRPERLVVHVLLVRVTADLSVPDGPNYEVLGINLRGMVDSIYRNYMEPEMSGIQQKFEETRDSIAAFVIAELDRSIYRIEQPLADAVETEKPSWFSKLLGRKAETPTSNASSAPAELQVELAAVSDWKARLATCEDSLQKACLDALIKTVDTMTAHRGRVIPDSALLAEIITRQVSNTHGAKTIESFIEPIWQRAVEQEGYRRLPAQDKPVIMNVKGASASGKSTIRPQQRQLAGKLGIPWEDFALISPDYWRKYLLDYESLEDDYKYGAMLTGRELEIIDRKLDKYMADKAASGTIAHMLIDRFRFDSFNAGVEDAADSKLLSRFGDTVYLFFMITPPAETVERAWRRGIKTGRFKAVDDLLYHNIEAFNGMPSLFLSWVNARDKHVHFEFLDNDVALGELPRTVAFGWNNCLTILDMKVIMNVDRYRKVNLSARSAETVLEATDSSPDEGTPFILSCTKRVPHIRFADQDSAQVYAVVQDGRLTWWDHDYIHERADDESIKQVMMTLGYSGEVCSELGDEAPVQPIDIEAEKRATVGYWWSGDVD